MSMKAENFPLETLAKFEEKYLPFFQAMLKASKDTVSVSEMAKEFRNEARQIRREMASLTGSGELRNEYPVRELVTEIEYYLGYYNCKDVALIGNGHVAYALLKNPGFIKRDLRLSLIFDPDIDENDRTGSFQIMQVSHFGDIVARMHVHLGVIAVSLEKAQAIADLMVKSGILAIWNVSGKAITVPPEIIAIDETFGEHEDIEHNEAIALSLLELKNQLRYKMGWNRY